MFDKERGCVRNAWAIGGLVVKSVGEEDLGKDRVPEKESGRSKRAVTTIPVDDREKEEKRRRNGARGLGMRS